MSEREIEGAPRRAILKGLAGALGVTVASSAVGHPEAGDHTPLNDPDHDEHRFVEGVTNVGYHSLGRKGSESLGGDPDEPHYGGISELKIEGDLAFVGILSSHEPTLDRGLAILDVSAYTRAEDETELEQAEMSLLSFVPNENQGTSVMDVKVSDDRQYAFISQQPIEALFQATSSNPDPEVNPGTRSTSTEVQGGSLKAVDISDPGYPEVVGSHDLWGLGPHNSDHHQIGGDDYVFAVRGPLGEPAGVFVLYFDRTTGDLELVNYWTHDAQLAQGETGYPVNDTYANGYEYYVHDIRVKDDPKTGRPLAFVANLNSGARVLDVSEPTNIEELGHFYCRRAHEIMPATVHDADGNLRRVFVTGQENPSSSYGTVEHHTGYAYLVDADMLFDAEFEQGKPYNLGVAERAEQFEEEGVREDDVTDNVLSDHPEVPKDPKRPLASWVLRDHTDRIPDDLDEENHDHSDPDQHWIHEENNHTEHEADGDHEDHFGIAFQNYTFSLHNVDILEENFGTESSPEYRQFVVAGHYHAGLRVLEFQVGGGDDHPTRRGGSWMEEVAYSRHHEEVPAESMFTGLTGAAPNYWCAVDANGVVWTSGINTGVYAFTVDDIADTDVGIPVGQDRAIDVEIVRDDGGVAYTGGMTARYDIMVDADRPVELRDRVPESWDPFENVADVENVRENVGDGTLVEFGEVQPDETVTYFVDVGEEEGAHTVGAAQYSTDGIDWTHIPDSQDSNVVGPSQN
jgi:hypothetical protein